MDEKATGSGRFQRFTTGAQHTSVEEHREVHTMMKLFLAAGVGLAFTAIAAVPAQAQTESVQQCQALKDRIDHYNRLRRGGGSASQMEGWKMQRRKNETKFRRAECGRYGKKIK
jgi:hypothetical protein